jgi:Tol biopolymer transport system component
MGEVYQATDTRLKRQVALKVLPLALSADAERLARLQREAEVLASLNHPNIAQIHGIEEREGLTALVMELVEGPTLADHSAPGPIPVDEALPIARQIAEALEAAHEHGIIHRDLKPANIKLRPDGVVKVLDFGLAKLADPGTSTASVNRTLSPTITSPAMTGMGVILGTAAYMAPEQAAGKAADKRADIWSFGVVLWELLTGERLFASGETTSHVLADVLRAPIDFDKIPAGPLRELLRRCLDRDVKTRLRDIGEARVVLSRPMTVSVAATPVASMAGSARAAWVAAALLAVSAIVALWAPWRTEPDRPLTRVEVDLGDNVTLPPTTVAKNVVISPDGRRLVYVASVDGSRDRLYIRRLDETDERRAVVELPGTEGAVGAAFSQDSQSIAFVAANRVYRISVDGGAALQISKTELSSNHVAWGDDGSIVVSGVGMGLLRIPPNGGEPEKLTELANGEAIHGQAYVLPGARTVLFVNGRSFSDATSIEAVPLAGGSRRVIVTNGTAPHYVPTGHLLYMRQGTLFAIRFDPDSLETVGDAIPVVTDVKVTYANRVPVSTFSVGSGTLVYRKSTGTDAIPGPANMRTSTVEWIDAGGKRSPLVSSPGFYFDLRVSPGVGQLVLTSINPSGANVSLFDPRRGDMTAMTSDGLSVNPVWSRPDGRYVVFLKPLGRGEVFWTRVLSSGQAQPLFEGARELGSFDADGKRFAYTRTEKGLSHVFIVAVTEENGQLKAGTPALFSPPESDEFAPEFSPDGRWVALVRNVSGQRDVWVRAFVPNASDNRAYEVKISINGGRNPRWSRNRQELLYHSSDQIMAVRYTIDGGMLVPEKPLVRLEKVSTSSIPDRSWDLTTDDRIAVAMPVEGKDAVRGEHTVVFIQNVFDEIRRRVK